MIDLNKYFEKDYIDITNGTEDYPRIEYFFCEDNPQVCITPLTQIFIHRTKTELFLILDIRDISSSTFKEKVEETCKDWENNIMVFLNFGDEYRDSLKYLKFNITLLFLYSSALKCQTNFFYELEKSTVNCRKIFLSCNGETVDEKDLSLLPFYFDGIKTNRSSELVEKEKELNALYPMVSNLDFLYKDQPLDEDQIEQFYRWLNNAN